MSIYFFCEPPPVYLFDFLTFDIFLTIWHLFDNLTSFWDFDFSFNLNHLSLSQGYFVEIPADDKIFDLDEAINLDTSKIQTETTGEKIVKQIQEWLLTKVNSSETAVLPEDKMQKLLVGVSSSIIVPFPSDHVLPIGLPFRPSFNRPVTS